MSWPMSQDYNEAIQSPASNFTDPDLLRGEAVCNALGLPVPYSGNFADVYQVRCPDGSRWAVKCFTREAIGLRERYQEISRHLRQAKLPFTVDFSYLDQGMRVAGKWHPVLKMQWVEGLTLNQFVGQYLDKPAMLEALLQLWAKMAKYLRAAEVGHCDLQHGNVLLVPGATPNSLALKLIDYDGMWVPALAGTKSGEVGHANFQHPRRLREGTYSLEVDRFPVLLIATALRALKAGGKDLWAKYDNGDNLLFKESDLADPPRSELFQELASLPDAGLVMLAAQVRAALKGSLESAALLEEVMPEARPAPAAKSPPTVVPTRKAVPIALPVAVAPSAPASDALAFDTAEDEVPRSFVRKKRGKKKSAGILDRMPLAAWIGVGVALVVLAALAGGLTVWALGDKSSPPAPRPPDNGVAQKDAGAQLTPDPKTPMHNNVAPPQEGPIINPPPPGMKSSGDDDWLKSVAALPTDRQVNTVADELKKRNPGFDGKVTSTIVDGVVVGLEFVTDEVTDIAPVRALVGLRTLNCGGSNPGKGRLADLSTLKGMPLLRLFCHNTPVSDLSPLMGMKLTELGCDRTKVSDLSPLRRMPLQVISLNNTPVSDLSPLIGMPLTTLYCGNTPVSDLSPLKGMPLTNLICAQTQVSDLSPLIGMPLTYLSCGDTRISDLSPLKGMPLNRLLCSNTPVSDLSPLNGMTLVTLSCDHTQVSDLSPLKGMPLDNLDCSNTQVSDLSPLKWTHVVFLQCDFKPERDAAILRSISTLFSINNKPAKEVLKK